MRMSEIARHTHREVATHLLQDDDGNLWEETYRLTRYQSDGTAVYTHEKTVLVKRAEKESGA